MMPHGAKKNLVNMNICLETCQHNLFNFLTIFRRRIIVNICKCQKPSLCYQLHTEHKSTISISKQKCSTTSTIKEFIQFGSTTYVDNVNFP